MSETFFKNSIAEFDSHHVKEHQGLAVANRFCRGINAI